MKNIITSIIIAFLSFSCKGQATYSLSTYTLDNLKNNNYIKDTNGILNPFVGTWKWTDPSNPNTIFTVVLTKEQHWNPNNINNYYKDVILGTYKYVVNGVILIDALSYTSTDILSTNYPPILGGISRPNFNKLSINMSDIIKSKTCKANFEITNPNSTTLTATWEMYGTEHYNINGQNPQQGGFSLPTNAILIKQP